jgi:hypothetical protein
MSNQLQLVFLNLILNLSDQLSTTGRGELRLSSRYLAQTKTIRIEFATNREAMALTDWMTSFQTPAPEWDDELEFGLSFSQDILLAHAGSLTFGQHENELVCKIELPLASVF